MALFFTEEDVARLLTMDDAVSAVEDAFRQLGEGSAVNHPRARVGLPGAMLHVMLAGSAEWGLLGLKAYIAKRTGASAARASARAASSLGSSSASSRV